MVCALALITNDLPEANFWMAESSVWVKLSGSISPSVTSELRYFSICLYFAVPAANTNSFFARRSSAVHQAPAGQVPYALPAMFSRLLPLKRSENGTTSG